MAHCGRGRRGWGKGNAIDMDFGAQNHSHMSRNDTSQQNQPQRKEIGELRRQIEALMDVVQRLQPPYEVFDASYDIEILDFKENLDTEDFSAWTNALERV